MASSLVPETLEDAKKSIKTAAIAGVVITILSAVVAGITGGVEGVIGAIFVFMFYGWLVLGVFLRSRFATVLMALLYSVDAVWSIVEREGGGVVLKIIIIVILIKAAVAAFVYHRDKGPDDEPNAFHTLRIVHIVLSCVGGGLLMLLVVGGLALVAATEGLDTLEGAPATEEAPAAEEAPATDGTAATGAEVPSEEGAKPTE